MTKGVTVPEEAYMRLAMQKANQGIDAGQTPFGACIVCKGSVVSCTHNTVFRDTDITAHAEIQALRTACARLGTIALQDCTIYSTCEPCPMCFSACHWAKIGAIVFGARIADAQQCGFSELTISNEEMKERGHSPVLLIPDFLREECVALFHRWQARPDRRLY